MNSEQFTNSIDFRYISDVLNKEEAIDILKEIESSKKDRIQKLFNEGYPSCTLQAG